MNEKQARITYSLDLEMERAALLLERGISLQRELYVGESRRFLILLDLSGGMERMLKLAWAMQIKNQSGQFPTAQEFKKAGHGLVRLVDVIAELYTDDFLKFDDARRAQDFLRNDIVFRRSLEILDSFAIRGRYFHVDSLGGATPEGDAPERGWSQMEMLISHELFPDPEDWAKRVSDLHDNSFRQAIHDYLCQTFELFGCMMFRLFVVGLPNTEAKQWSPMWQRFLRPAWGSGKPLGEGRLQAWTYKSPFL